MHQRFTFPTAAFLTALFFFNTSNDVLADSYMPPFEMPEPAITFQPPELPTTGDETPPRDCRRVFHDTRNACLSDQYYSHLVFFIPTPDIPYGPPMDIVNHCQQKANEAEDHCLSL